MMSGEKLRHPSRVASSMTLQASHIDEWINKAFDLAFFLHGERETAKTIALNAMAKLETASNAQYKRSYYTPTGRAETARATRSRVSLNDLQLLQRLVFIESEAFERQSENAEGACPKRLLTYFIKHLVRISLKRNSFYVTLGISRILHNYATVEAMEIYNVVVQNPERVHDDYYYRSRKGVLMKELKTRFGDLLDIVRLNRGEERFRAASDDGDLAETAGEALKFFTPWNSSCAIPDRFDPFDDVIKPFHFDKDDPDAEHRIEVNRIHAALHPNCFGRLTGALDLPPPKEKMEIPKFMFTQNQDTMNDDNWGDPPQLDPDELKTIKGILTAQAESRKAMSANLLRVMVDDRQQAVVDLGAMSSVSFDLDESAELIELRARGNSGEIVLATHLLSFDDLEKGLRTFETVSEGGQKISYDFVPTIDDYGEVTSLSCTIGYAETAWQKRFASALKRAVAPLVGGQRSYIGPAMVLGGLLLTFSLAWLLYSGADPADQVAIAPVQQEQDQSTPVMLPQDDGTESPRPDTPSLPNDKRPADRKTEQPPPTRAGTEQRKRRPSAVQRDELLAIGDEYRDKSYTDENGILRLPIRERNEMFATDGGGTRGNAKPRGKTLSEVALVYIEITGDAVYGHKIREALTAEINAAGPLRITGDKDAADAAMKIYVRHESDAETRDEASITAIVRLVNAKGFVIYPDLKRVSGWKYVGTVGKLPKRISRDLLNRAGSARGRK